LPREAPRVLLIDEIDKSDLDLPNDMLHVLEEGSFEIPELVRLRTDDPVNVTTADSKLTTVDIVGGKVQCYEFPLIFMTSNGERDFPSAFLRRCLRLTIPAPSSTELQAIVKRQMSVKQFDVEATQTLTDLTADLAGRVGGRLRTTDQLLNTFFLRTQRGFSADIEEATFRDVTQSDVPPPPNEATPRNP
jgi:MoxR-like ATPase